MLKKLMLLGLGMAVAAGVLGCDEELAKALTGDAARMVAAGDGDPVGNFLMNQLQQRDQLQDGSCGGTCDGVPNPDAGGWQGSGGAGSANGAGDIVRLRDGSCEL